MTPLRLFSILLVFCGQAHASFNQSQVEARASDQAKVIVARAEKRCTANKRVYTACLKNLQLQAIEKKIGVLEKTFGLVQRQAKPGPAKAAMLKHLQKQIAYETQFVEFYHGRAFDGIAALELDVKHLLVKEARLAHLTKGRVPSNLIGSPKSK